MLTSSVLRDRHTAAVLDVLPVLDILPKDIVLPRYCHADAVTFDTV